MVKNLTKVTLNRIEKIPSHVPVIENTSKTWAEVAQEAAESAQEAASKAEFALSQIQGEVDFQDAYSNNIAYTYSESAEVETSGVSLYISKEFIDGAIKLEQIVLKSASQVNTILMDAAYMHVWELINGTWTPLGVSNNTAYQTVSSFSAWNFNNIKTSGGNLYISFHTTNVQNPLPTHGLQFNCVGGESTDAYIIKQNGTTEQVCPYITLRYYRSYFSSYEHQTNKNLHLDPGQKDNLVLSNKDNTINGTLTVTGEVIATQFRTPDGKDLVTKEEIENLEFVQGIKGYNEGEEISTSSKVVINIQDARGANSTAQDFWKDAVNFDGTNITIFNKAKDGTAKYKDSNITSINKDKAIYINNTQINIQTDNLVDGTSMFENNLFLETVEDLPLDNLEVGDKMFKNTIISSFDIDIPNLISGEEMFQNTKLEIFNKDLTSLKNGKSMFKSCAKLSQFISELSNLENGDEMFHGCKLSPESLLYIFDSIPEYKSETHNLNVTLDADIPQQNYADLLGYATWEDVVAAFNSKGWILTI